MSGTGARWAVAEQISAAVRGRRPETIAVGVHGTLAHGDVGDDVDLTAVVPDGGDGQRRVRRRFDGVVVQLAVIGADEYLRRARTLSTLWPLAADEYLTTKPVHDPDGWYDRLRDSHLARLADAPASEFAALAREAWCEAAVLHVRAGRLAERYDTDGAVLLLGQARLATAIVTGLLTRTYFRDSADAIARADLGDADIGELGQRLAEQAAELAARGRPVDVSVAELLG